MTKPMDFQTIILTLQKFWADQGCLIWQPYYTQVGAGTYNPATFLRVIGPEPWNVAYVEPSIRPDDGRYGENPNRLQQFYQFQVILKPDPGNPQEVYLRSLQALGIDPLQHDIRFVEDNWESPALGAWGLGWEVWLDGQEITQFTYFQQAGGITLDPVSVEITYGLERIAMTLQGVRNFRDIRWNGERTDGDVNLQGEQEHSKYYFELADVERLRQMYTLFESEAELSLANHLVLPAHDYVLKCSHTFNILDTRGAVGVTERQALFSRMRDLSRRVAEAYLAQREELGFPWVKAPEAQVKDEAAVHPQANEQAQKPSGKPFDDFLLEIGVEELPAGDLASALAQLRERVPAWLDEMRLTHGDVRVLGAPRRLVVSISDLAARQADRTSVVKGPPAARAYDAEGKPTKAAEGFAHSRGIEVGALELRELDGGKYVVATVHETGRPALDVLSEALPGVVAGIHFDKSMRWNSTGISFSRPIRWLLALLGGEVVPFEYAGLRSNRVTRGLRFHVPEEFNLASSKEYFECLKSQGILLDPEQRKGEIWAQVQHTAAAAGCSTPDDPDLLEEVTQLVEAPTALLGSFDPSHLELPPEVLISVMKKHQRYFPVYQGSLEQKKLAPHFIALRNGDGRYLDLVTDGNEQVIRARFADAAFFVREDVQRKLSDFLPRLSTLTFQVKLGSMLDKTHRIQASVEKLIERLHVNPQDAAVARRAAELCKADLVTQMVVEMTTLQGVMGRYYARRSGEPEAVAQAIYEHYLPRFAGDPAQIGLPGLLVGIADRLDTLSGLFAAGLAPSGTKDPFAQRRAALGLVQALQENHLDLNLSEGLEMAAANLPIAATPASQAACLEFIQGRMRSYLVEQRSFKYDVVDAVLAGQGSYPNRALQAVVELSAWVARPDWTTILPAYSRCVRITRDQVQRFSVDPAAFADPAEKELFQALQMAEQTPKRPGSVDDFLKAFEPMIPAVNKFFDAVLVMAEGERVRANRLGLLQRIAALPQGVADLAPLEGF